MGTTKKSFEFIIGNFANALKYWGLKQTLGPQTNAPGVYFKITSFHPAFIHGHMYILSWII